MINEGGKSPLKYEEMYRTLFARMDQALALCEIIFDNHGQICDFRYLEINRAFERLTGISGERAIGRSAWELVSKIKYPPVEVIRKALQTEEPAQCEQYDETTNCWYENRVFGLSEDKFAICYNDISGRKKATEEIARQTDLITRAHDELWAKANLPEMINDAVVAFNTAHRITFWNTAAEQMFGWTKEEALYEKAEKIFRAVTTDVDNAERQSGFRVGSMEWVENISYRKDGSPIWVSPNSRTFYDKNGQESGYVSVLRDITEYKRMEEAVRESEEKYRMLFESMGEGFVLANMIFDDQERPVDYVILDINPAYEKQSGLSKEQVLGKRGTEFVPAIDPIWFERYGEVVRSGNPMRFEEYNILSNRWLEAYAYPLNKLNKLAVIFSDITDRKKAEKALCETALVAEMHASELDTIISSIAGGVVIYDIFGNIIRINDFARNIFGYFNDEDKMPYLERHQKVNLCKADGTPYGPEEAPLYRALHGAVINNEEVLINRNFGNPVWVSVTLAPIYDSNNNASGVVQMFIDITERKRKAEAILASERELLQVTLNSIGEGVVAVDRQDRIIFINEAAANIISYSQAETVGKPLSKIFYVFDDKTSEQIDMTTSSNKFGNPVLITGDFKEIPIDVNVSPIKVVTGEIIGTVIVFQDISAKQKIEQELLKTEKLESIGILAGGIAHDFNNILAAILGNIQLAMMKLKKNEDIMPYLSSTIETTRKASDLTKQLLTFSKGGAPIKRDASLVELIKDTVQFALIGSKVKPEFAIPEDLWIVSVDEGQISQVIYNLVINAKQAMPKGGRIHICAENISVDTEIRYKSGKYVKITVRDQGVGIPKENLPKIFDPFFTTKKEGNGLGLATSYSIINRHGGYIEVESQEGIGTVFLIFLPASEITILQPESKKAMAVSGDGLKILIMDDEEKILNAVGEMLECYGYRVVLAKDGTAVIENYKEAKDSGVPFDAVIVDLTVPGGMGGQEAIAHLREIDPKIKAIISSGYADDPIIADYEGFGFAGVVGKPYKIDELIEVLHKVTKPLQLPLKLTYE